MADLATELSTYAAGLDAVLELLGRLDALAAAQREASQVGDLDHFARLGDERDRVTAALVQLEADLSPLRVRLGHRRKESEHSPIYRALVERHRKARELVDGVLATDAETVKALKEAEIARRAAAQALETGEQTLAAYRKVISPNRTSALIDARS
ncbi:MAG: hypothetical protein AB1635_18080 [Acidobacteriota bacterium]